MGRHQHANRSISGQTRKSLYAGTGLVMLALAGASPALGQTVTTNVIPTVNAGQTPAVSVTGTGTAGTALVVTSGGTTTDTLSVTAASTTNGINNGGGGITNAGAISGATTVL